MHYCCLVFCFCPGFFWLMTCSIAIRCSIAIQLYYVFRGYANNLVVPLCKNLLCNFPFFSEDCCHFWPYKGIYQKSIMPFGIIFSETIRLQHRGTTTSIALPLRSELGGGGLRIVDFVLRNLTSIPYPHIRNYSYRICVFYLIGLCICWLFVCLFFGFTVV